MAQNISQKQDLRYYDLIRIMPMTDVLSYRTDKIEQLKKLAKEKNISLSQLSSEIIDEYLQFYALTQKFDMYRDSKEMISFCFELIDKSDLDKVVALASKGDIQTIKTMIQEYSFENITDVIRSWYQFNNFKVEEFDQDGSLKFVCKNNMSENWNTVIATELVAVYKYFGYDGVIESKEKGLFDFKILKQKSS